MGECSKYTEEQQLQRYLKALTRSTWVAMIQRCHDPKHQSFKYYGERGIKVCQRWRSFPNFLKDMGLRPEKGYTIDRLDNDGGYEPGNCRWATWEEQRQSKRPAKTELILEFDGRSQTLSKWAAEYGITRNQLYRRLQLGWTLEDSLKTQIRSHPSQKD